MVKLIENIISNTLVHKHKSEFIKKQKTALGMGAAFVTPML